MKTLLSIFLFTRLSYSYNLIAQSQKVLPKHIDTQINLLTISEQIDTLEILADLYSNEQYLDTVQIIAEYMYKLTVKANTVEKQITALHLLADASVKLQKLEKALDYSFQMMHLINTTDTSGLIQLHRTFSSIYKRLNTNNLFFDHKWQEYHLRIKHAPQEFEDLPGYNYNDELALAYYSIDSFTQAREYFKKAT